MERAWHGNDALPYPGYEEPRIERTLEDVEREEGTGSLAPMRDSPMESRFTRLFDIKGTRDPDQAQSLKVPAIAKEALDKETERKALLLKEQTSNMIVLGVCVAMAIALNLLVH